MQKAISRVIPFSVNLFQFQIKDEIEAARIEATKALTRPLATLSFRPFGSGGRG